MVGKRADINYLWIFDSFPDMILLINPENYKIVAVNNGYLKKSGLFKDQMFARIVSIRDVYQALISDRPYRKAYSKKKALEILRKESAVSFDKDLVDALIRIETKHKAIPHKYAPRQ